MQGLIEGGMDMQVAEDSITLLDKAIDSFAKTQNKTKVEVLQNIIINRGDVMGVDRMERGKLKQGVIISGEDTMTIEYENAVKQGLIEPDVGDDIFARSAGDNASVKIKDYAPELIGKEYDVNTMSSIRGYDNGALKQEGDPLIAEALKYKSAEEFDEAVKYGGYGNKSIAEIKGIIDNNTKGAVDFRKIEKELLASGQSYFLTTIKPNDLKIEEEKI